VPLAVQLCKSAAYDSSSSNDALSSDGGHVGALRDHDEHGYSAGASSGNCKTADAQLLLQAQPSTGVMTGTFSPSAQQENLGLQGTKIAEKGNGQHSSMGLEQVKGQKGDHLSIHGAHRDIGGGASGSSAPDLSHSSNPSSSPSSSSSGGGAAVAGPKSRHERNCSDGSQQAAGTQHTILPMAWLTQGEASASEKQQLTTRISFTDFLAISLAMITVALVLLIAWRCWQMRNEKEQEAAPPPWQFRQDTWQQQDDGPSFFGSARRERQAPCC